MRHTPGPLLVHSFEFIRIDLNGIVGHESPACLKERDIDSGVEPTDIRWNNKDGSMMMWSKIRSNLIELRAPSLRKRLDLHTARYRFHYQEYGRLWVELDKVEIISYETIEYHRRVYDIECEMEESIGSCSLGTMDDYSSFSCSYYAARAFMSRHGIIDDRMAFDYVQSYLDLSIEEALRSISPLQRMLAVSDRRIGKRRLRRMGRYLDDHPLVSRVFQARCAAEEIPIDRLLREEDDHIVSGATLEYFDLPR